MIGRCYKDFFQALNLFLVCAMLALSSATVGNARFLTPDTWDPILAGVDFNRYAYGANDPINMSDPNGHAIADSYDPLNGLLDAESRGYNTRLGSAWSLDPQRQADFHETVDTAKNIAIVGSMFVGVGEVAATGLAVKTAVKSAWNMAPVVRGAFIEAKFGANLAKNFPTIDKLRNMVATSIKSIDVTAKTYLDAAKFENKIKSYIDKLAAFTSATWAGRRVAYGVNYKRKTLELGLNKRKLTNAQKEALERLERYAKDNDVKLDTKNVK